METGFIVAEHTPIQEIMTIGQNPIGVENIHKDNGNLLKEVSIGYKEGGNNLKIDAHINLKT
jgi:hypothetical protein